MANTLTPIIAKIIARSLPVLRQNCVMPRLVNSTYSENVMEPGQTITIPKTSAHTAYSMSPSSTPKSPTDRVVGSETITLDQWYGDNFYLTDQEVSQVMARKDFVPSQMEECLKALANNVDQYFLRTLYKDTYLHRGTAGTTPFALDPSVWSGSSGARRDLNAQLAPLDNRHLVLDVDAEANAVDLEEFQSTAWRGDADGIVFADIGFKLGARWWLDQNVGTHTAGTFSAGSPLVDGAVAADATSMDIDGGSASETILDGDVFTVAGASGMYVFTADKTASSGAITGATFTPAAPTGGFANNAAITIQASHDVNLAFQRNAFGFASAPLSEADLGLGNVKTVIDPVSGLALRLEVTRQYKQTIFEFDILYGGAVVRPEFAVRIMG